MASMNTKTEHPVLLIQAGTRDSIIAQSIMAQEGIAHDVVCSVDVDRLGFKDISVYPTLFLGWNKFEGLDAIARGVCTPPEV